MDVLILNIIYTSGCKTSIPF